MIMIYFNTSCVKLSTVPRDKKGKSGIAQIRKGDMYKFCSNLCNKVAVVFPWGICDNKQVIYLAEDSYIISKTALRDWADEKIRGE